MENPGNQREEPTAGGQRERLKAGDESVAKPPRPWSRKLMWGAGILFIIGAVTMGGAEIYTAQPSFCRSCHIMEPYWQSWSHDMHGAKLGVRCVDCHYAPGERFTVKAKFKGLSQVTSYFSGRAGTARPRAHVADASCLVSECHGDEKYVNKPLPIGEVRTEDRVIGDTVTKVQRTPTVTFLHKTHLDTDEKLKTNEQQLEAVTARLRSQTPVDVFARIEHIARSVRPVAEQAEAIQAELKARELTGLLDDAMELVRLHDMRARLTQLAGLTCASCHGYDATGKNHFTIDMNTCYTCHFTNQAFNAGTGQCLKCHAPPTRQILVHGTPTTAGESTSIMDHRDILERNIDCASCHLDVVQGRSDVNARDCERCHDQARYLEGFETRDIEKVQEYHRVHVAAQRARCPDCHHSVRHELIEPTLVTTSAGFVQPILDECQHCHPNHHREQVELLMGVGGVGVEQAMPNAMFGSRVNCRACHVESGTDFKGAPLIEATATTCVACHEEKYGELMTQWLGELSAYLTESEKAMELVRKRIDERRAQGQAIPPRVEELVGMAAQNLELVQAGNGIHNKNYAVRLLDLGDEYLREAMEILNQPVGEEKTTR
ncbi:MAG TPA: NapC/NirT family cytochrome c [Phycisphaerae bacterium]|nr:NapC/NirT family cytochrome c [Phycisphaerae bacterium]HOJ75065.1 NapC/NirT family cytochrome c [Phycisphaerae bacterium]HOM51936.1 NapC/NirT family cytochrome c [Phycisphaerae bacterium]HON65814.1 NapC/NirT family cytochrome c [Phycisphaerae bacterium]HOQ87035.1 NapC/NirT family cytochrome c [Phycisphaerae bacterium]